MPGLSFQELWEDSQTFRTLFLYNNIFKSLKVPDMGLAEALWDDRYPKVEWDFCLVDECSALVEAGSVCGEHAKKLGEPMPKWRWYKGDLHRYIRESMDIKGQPRRIHREYRRNEDYVWKYHYGKPKAGYQVKKIDRNPFNNRIGNLFVVSRYVAPAFDAGVINAAEALRMDEELPEELVSRLGGGRQNGWVYGIGSIASAAGLRHPRVRQEVSRGNLDPGDLGSVVDFCQKYREKCRIE